MKRPRHPSEVPLNEWTDGWLTMSVASHLDVGYLFAHDHEKEGKGWPATREQKIAFLISKGDVPKAGTGLPDSPSN